MNEAIRVSSKAEPRFRVMWHASHAACLRSRCCLQSSIRPLQPSRPLRINGITKAPDRRIVVKNEQKFFPYSAEVAAVMPGTAAKI